MDVMVNVEKSVLMLSSRLHVDINKAYTLALDVLHDVTALVNELEEQDDNLDITKTKLPSVDELFKDDPVSEYVKAIIDVKTGNRSEEAQERVRKAALEVAKAQGTFVEEEDDREYTTEEFIDLLIEEVGVTGSEYAAQFKTGLLSAIDTLEERFGYSEFFVATSKGVSAGTLRVNSARIIITVDGKDFIFQKVQEEVEGPAEGEREDDQESKAKDADNILVDIAKAESTYYAQVDDIMERIETYLASKKVFAKDDLDLIHFYLLQLPSNSDYDVDSLNDRTLVLAWKQEMYKKNK